MSVLYVVLHLVVLPGSVSHSFLVAVESFIKAQPSSSIGGNIAFYPFLFFHFAPGLTNLFKAKCNSGFRSN